MLSFLNFLANLVVVPGITVDLINIILSFLLFTTCISCKADSKISTFILPSKLDGVGTETNIKSDSLIVSFKVCIVFKGSLS